MRVSSIWRAEHALISAGLLLLLGLAGCSDSHHAGGPPDEKGGSVASAEPSLHLTGRIHFNINTNDYERTRSFYRLLGFANAIGPFPETNTLEMAHSMGMAEPYRMFAEIIYLGAPDIDPMQLHVPTGRMIDLIHWREPANTQAAYPGVNSLGIAKVVLGSSDLEADLARLAAAGYVPVAEPADREGRYAFALLKDPAGTLLELREVPGQTPVESNGSFVTHIDHLAINVSDLGRSLAFYEVLGFVATNAASRTSSLDEALALGLSEPFSVREAMLEHSGDGSRILLSEWLSPRDLTPPHAAPINHPGMQRINYASMDIDQDVATLRAMGVPFLSPTVRCCDGDRSTMGIAVFEDPDGTYLQMLGTVEPLQAN
jgi:catechol 2,3-dioxygenase-like lactoylglutathione lyase family enzyme